MIEHITESLQHADGIVILTGAGMGVDAGIPDFRGKDGVWNEDKDTFMRYSKASSFHEHPLDSWNFYIKRYLSYLNTSPHSGYYDLLQLSNIFVVTSNIDGHFKKAGYDSEKIYEIHGNLEYIQCSVRCSNDTQPMPDFKAPLTTEDEMPRCPRCGKASRPQVMMFNDPWFVPTITLEQSLRFMDWELHKKNIVGIEIGAGLAVPSIRMIGQERTSMLIRVNPNDHQISRPNDISIRATAIEGIRTVLSLFGDIT